MSAEGPRRVVAITGGGSGIGAATARRLRAADCLVIIVGRRREMLEAVAAETGAVPMVADMSEQEEIEALVSQIGSTYGRLDGLVLSAGTIIPGQLTELSVKVWRTTLETNLTGPFLAIRAAIPWLLTTRGSVVAVGSIGADRVGAGSAAYGASKAGLLRVIRSVALEYGPHGVRANAVNPGWVRSEMADAEMDALGSSRGVDREAAYGLVTKYVPSRRAGSSDEAAAAIAWLLSSDASYVNGAVLTVDGGTSIVGVGTLPFMALGDE